MSMGRKRSRAICLTLCLIFLFSAFMPLSARAENEIGKVLTTISSEPVAINQISSVTASTGTEGCYVAELRWYDTNENRISDYFRGEDCRMELELMANDGYVFSEAPEVYFNNEKADYAMSEDGKSLVVKKVISPLLWQPTPIKHPGGETVTQGGWASFVATAMYANDFQWCFISPEGKNYDIESTRAKFPGLTVDGNGSGKIIVHNIPLEMDGWKAACKFIGPGGSILSKGALITVAAAEDGNSPEAAETPKPENKPEEKPQQTEAEAESAQPTEHVHEFDTQWHTNEECHWHECSCGEKAIIEYHSFQWEQIKEPKRHRPGLEHGVCTVCGYETDREVEYEPGYRDNSGFKILKIIIIAVIVIALLCLAAFILQVRHSNRYSRRGKHVKK